MKSIRVFYKKNGPLRFVSHLDMNRLMFRLLRRSGLHIWYTEGFNSRPYVNFALPLSLGFTSDYECFDFRLEDDETATCLEIEKRLSAVAPDGLEIIRAAEPVNKTGHIAKASYCVTLDDPMAYEPLRSFLSLPEITVEKKNKKGVVKQINLAEKIHYYKLEQQDGALVLDLILPAGGGDNINPSLLIQAFLDRYQQSVHYTVSRTMLYLEGEHQFV